MRDLTKSSLSFSWSMSLFGLQQLGNLLMPNAAATPESGVTDAFDRVTDAMAKQLGEALGETYRAGDKLQRGVVDLTFRLIGCRPSPPTPTQGIGRCGSCARPAWPTEGPGNSLPSAGSYRPMYAGGQP
jgi:hypothetical protein